MNTTPQVTVIGNSEATEEQYHFCVELGELLADLGCIVITGGRGGVMEAVAKGVNQGGGIAVGILPSDQFNGNAYNTITIPTGIGFARNSMNVLAGHVVVAVGGGAGTLSELAFAWSYEKPVFCHTGTNGWSNELIGQKLDTRREALFEPFTTLEELKTLLQPIIEAIKQRG